MRTLTAQELEERLLDYLYDELAPDERAAFEASVGAYPAIQAELEAHRRTRVAVAGLAGPPVSPAGDAWDATLASIIAEANAAASPDTSVGAEVIPLRPGVREAVSSTVSPVRGSLGRGWLMAAAAVLAAGGAVIAGRDEGPPETASAGQSREERVAPVVVAQREPAPMAEVPSGVRAPPAVLQPAASTAAAPSPEIVAARDALVDKAQRAVEVASKKVAAETADASPIEVATADAVARDALGARSGGGSRVAGVSVAASARRSGSRDAEVVAVLDAASLDSDDGASRGGEGFAPAPPPAASARAAETTERFAMAAEEADGTLQAPRPAALARGGAKDDGRIDELWKSFSRAVASGDVAAAERALASLEAAQADAAALRRARAELHALHASRQQRPMMKSAPAAAPTK